MKTEINPSAKAQGRYPIDKFPCSRCANPNEGLPHLIDNGPEFYWHHRHDRPGSSMRSGYPRFGASDLCGAMPKAGTAASRYKRDRGGYSRNHVLRSDEEYAKAVEAVEERGADDAWQRDGLRL